MLPFEGPVVRRLIAPLLALAPLLLCGLAGCASAGDPMKRIAPQVNMTRFTGAVVLSPGDTFTVDFIDRTIDSWRQVDVEVRPDGRASLRSLDDVMVAGLTVDQLDRVLTGAYERILQVPELTVTLTRMAERRVFVMGELKNPGAFPLESDHLTLEEALALAGGPRPETALLKQVLLVRWVVQDRQRKVWTIDIRQDQWDTKEPIFLQPHDLIYVPNKPIVRVNIWVDQYIRQMIPLPGFSPLWFGGTGF